MAELLDGKRVSKIVRDNIKKEVAKLDDIPCLHAILIGDNQASAIYVRTKSNTCERLGMESEKTHLPADVSQDYLEDLINNLNNSSVVDGILVQFPLPDHINTSKVMDMVHPLKDVDGFNSVNIAKMYKGEKCLEPCTPRGIIHLLDHYNIPIEGQKVTIVGRSVLVGKPLQIMMTNRNATVTLCHSRTKNLEYEIKNADILVAAVGKPNWIKGDMIKEGAVIIDVGINKVEDDSEKGYRIVGDIDKDAYERASYITPVPGGVGMMTVAMLMQNTLDAYFMQN